MIRESVTGWTTSSNVHSIAYDHATQTLEVCFLDRDKKSPGAIYQYSPVPASVWEEMKQAGASIGAILNRDVKRNPEIVCVRIEDAA